MDGKTYMPKGYSSYPRIPAQQGSHDHVLQNPVNQHMVDSKMINKVRAPAVGYTSQFGSPTKFELLNEYQQGSHDHVLQNPVNQHMVDSKMINKVRAPAVGYTSQFGSPTKFELLNEYVYGPNMARSPKYASPSYYEVNNKPNYSITHENSNKRIFASPIHGYSSEESNYGPSLPGVGQVRTREFYGPNQSLQTASPRGTHGEASGYFEESVNHLPRLDPRQRGVLNNLATRGRPLETQRQKGVLNNLATRERPLETQSQKAVLNNLATRERPLETQSHYNQPPFVAKPNNTGHNFTNTKRN